MNVSHGSQHAQPWALVSARAAPRQVKGQAPFLPWSPQKPTGTRFGDFTEDGVSLGGISS